MYKRAGARFGREYEDLWGINMKDEQKEDDKKKAFWDSIAKDIVI